MEDSLSASTRRDGDWGRGESKEDPRLWTLGCVQSRGGLGFSVVLQRGQVYMEKGRKKEKLGSPPCCADGVNPAALEISLGRAKRELVEDKVDAHLRGAGEGKTF